VVAIDHGADLGLGLGLLEPQPNPVSPGRAVGLSAIFILFIAGAAVAVSGVALIVEIWVPNFATALRGSPWLLVFANTLAACCVIDVERRWRGSVWKGLPLPLMPISWAAPATLLAGLGLVLICLWGWIQIDPWIRAVGWLTGPETGWVNLATHPWSATLALIVVAPLTEEFVCRYMVLGGLLRRVRPRRAILLSAVLFSALHLSLWQAPVTFLLGLLLGWVYYRTRSLSACIAGHALHNGVVLLTATSAAGQPELSTAASFGWVATPLALGIGLGLLLIGVGRLRRVAPVPPADLMVVPPPLPGPKRQPRPPPLPGMATVSPFQQPAIGRSKGMSADLAALVTHIAERARAASHALATVPTAQKNTALEKLADLIPGAAEQLIAANAKDLAAAEENGLTAAQIDRLTLTPERLEQLAESVRQVALLPDPVGAVLATTTRPNGLVIEKRRVPIGVIGIIYEARPNVTIDCAILCLKSGNAAILRGGKEIFHTNTALAALIAEALSAAELPTDAVQLIPTTDRAALNTMLKLDELIHCIIPRGGEGLIRFVAQNSTIPVIKHYTGVCCVYLDQAADPTLAVSLTVNAKTQRPGVCNAAEQLLVDAAGAETLLPPVARALHEAGVILRVDDRAARILAAAEVPHEIAGPEDFTAEYLGLVMAIRIVDGVESAITAINRDSSGHSETIVTTDADAAARFQAAVDSSAVFWNASTRFNDGFEFGFGAEIGISTDRLHARGPMGLPELCSYKYVVTGTGQIRT
jgi:glutamate-5-semialdehyde dehydrogenase